MFWRSFFIFCFALKNSWKGIGFLLIFILKGATMEHRGLARLNIASSQADHIDIVCPEAVAILQQREAVARDSPEIASFPPIICSQRSFNAAIEYLELSLAYENILRSSTCLYPSLDLMNLYQNTLKEMLSYVETLQDHHLDYFKREKDQQEFSKIYYYLNQRLALSYLTIMMFDMARAPSYLQNFIEAKKRVPPSSSFYKEMQKIITDMLEAKPDLVSVLYPQQSASKVRIEKPKLSKKLRQRQKVARQVKIASLNQ